MTYLAYAGIGSRETPDNVLKIMHHIGAYLFTEGWTLRSGGAPKADEAFEQGVNTAHQQTFHPAKISPKGKEIYLPWKGFNNSPSRLHPGAIPFTRQEIEFVSSYHPAWHRCSPAAQKMHTRNVRQILGCKALHGAVVSPVKFVVCWTEGGKHKGGTSQALRIAESCHIPIVNFGKANTQQELEALMLEVDRLQNQFKQAA